MVQNGYFGRFVIFMHNAKQQTRLLTRLPNNLQESYFLTERGKAKLYFHAKLHGSEWLFWELCHFHAQCKTADTPVDMVA